MIGQPRAPGRHRAGQPYSLVHRRIWDGPARHQAEVLERSHFGWVVLYGPGSRRFYAIATGPVPEPVMVCDPTAEGLEELMRQAETALYLQTAASTSGASGRPRYPRPSVGRRHAVRPAGGLPYPPEGGTA